MSFTYQQLQEKSDKELIKQHDENSGILHGTSNKETPEMLRNELFRRELRRINEKMEVGNTTMTRLTWVISIMTLLILILTSVLVCLELELV